MNWKRILKTGIVSAVAGMSLHLPRPAFADPTLVWSNTFPGFVYGVSFNANGYIYIANSTGTGFFQCDPNTGAFGNVITVAGGIGRDLMSDAAGYIYGVNASNQLVKVNPTNGNVIWASATGYTGSVCGAIDSNNGYVYVFSNTYGRLLQFDFSGNLLKSIASKHSYPSGVAVDQSGNVYVTGSNSPSYLDKYNSSLTHIASVTTGNFPKSPVVDSLGYIYVVCVNSNTLQKYDSSLVPQWSPAATTMTTPLFASTNAAGSIYVFNRQYIQKFTSSGGSPLWTYMYSSNNSGTVYLATDSNLAFYISRISDLTKYIDGCNGPFPVTWTDPTITADSTPVRAAHVSELRSQINSLRADAGLASCAWTDPAIAADTTKVRKVHVDEMRSCLSQVFTTCKKPAPLFTDPTITANNTRIRKVHVDELRNAVATAP